MQLPECVEEREGGGDGKEDQTVAESSAAEAKP
jgi:hypothetical protein